MLERKASKSMGQCFTSNPEGDGRKARIHSEAKGSVTKVNGMK